MEEKKEAPSKIEEISELIKRFCVADSQARIYSVDHPSTKESIKKAYEWLLGMIDRKKGPVVISMTEGKILFEGFPIEEKNPAVRRYALGFDKIHINNLFFNPGLTYNEFEDFHRILGKGPRYINEHPGGLMGVFKEFGIEHIETKEVSYVMITEDEKGCKGYRW